MYDDVKGDMIHKKAQTWRISEIWMPHAMVFMHCIINTYPDSAPSPVQQYHYRRFFILLENVLPCVRCRRYYHDFMETRPLTSNVLQSREGMRQWIHRLYIFLVQKGILEPGAVGRSCEEVDEKILERCQQEKKIFGAIDERVWRYTRVWGPHAWVFLHSVANTFPLRPTHAQKEQYRQFFDTLVYVLPCKICREHYAQWLRREPIALAVNSRSRLQAWISELHNHVNSRLEKETIHNRDKAQHQLLWYALHLSPLHPI